MGRADQRFDAALNPRASTAGGRFFGVADAADDEIAPPDAIVKRYFAYSITDGSTEKDFITEVDFLCLSCFLLSRSPFSASAQQLRRRGVF